MLSNEAAVLTRWGDPAGIAIAEVPLPHARRGEVRVRVLASSVQFTDTVIRRHRYPQVRAKPPFVLGYDVVGEIDEVGDGVVGWSVGDRVADLTVTGSNVRYRTLRAEDLTRVPRDVDPAEAATLILSWMTAQQLLHRCAKVATGERALVLGAAGAVGQALLILGRRAGLEVWGAASARHAPLIRALGATPIDPDREDYARSVPAGFDVVFDGIAEDGYRRSWSAVKRGGRLCAFGFTAGVERPRLIIAGWIARLYLWSAGARDRRARFFSINTVRARHPQWFRKDLEELLSLLASREIQPRVEERIGFDRVADAHRRLERGGIEGKIVLTPDRTPAA